MMSCSTMTLFHSFNSLLFTPSVLRWSTIMSSQATQSRASLCRVSGELAEIMLLRAMSPFPLFTYSIRSKGHKRASTIGSSKLLSPLAPAFELTQPRMESKMVEMPTFQLRALHDVQISLHPMYIYIKTQKTFRSRCWLILQRVVTATARCGTRDGCTASLF